MKAIRDPEGAELRHLEAACPLDGKDVLEIGCGAGWLTWQYAALPRHVVGIDPDADSLAQARVQSNIVAPGGILANIAPGGVSAGGDGGGSNLPKVSFVQAKAQVLPFPSWIFDVALFASSF
jgi:ubiquinone/menaquinone biosynthesis C-methylase UbiE